MAHTQILKDVADTALQISINLKGLKYKVFSLKWYKIKVKREI